MAKEENKLKIKSNVEKGNQQIRQRNKENRCIKEV